MRSTIAPSTHSSDMESAVGLLSQDQIDAIDDHDLTDPSEYETESSRSSLDSISQQHWSKLPSNKWIKRRRRDPWFMALSASVGVVFLILLSVSFWPANKTPNDAFAEANSPENDKYEYCTTWPVDADGQIDMTTHSDLNRLQLGSVAPIGGWEKPEGIRIVAMVFYGRKRNVDILDCYLQQNLAVNGGYLDEVMFLIHTEEQGDLDWLDGLISKNQAIYKVINEGGCEQPGWGCLWDHATEDKSIYIKIDDDIAYIHPDAIPQLVHTRINVPHPYAISANLVNCPITAMEHYHVGAIHPFVPEISHEPSFAADVTWRPSAKPLFNSKIDHRNFSDLRNIPVPYQGHTWLLISNNDGDLVNTPIAKYDRDRGGDFIQFGHAWDSWGISAQQQYSLLHNIEENRMDRYYFGRNIDYPRDASAANASSIIPPIEGGPGGEQTWNTGFDRFNINFLAVWGSDIREQLPISDDDEGDITEGIPQRTGRPILVDTRAVVSHMSFGPQKDGIRKTDLLDRYRALANEAACPGANLKVPFDPRCEGF